VANKHQVADSSYLNALLYETSPVREAMMPHTLSVDAVVSPSNSSPDALEEEEDDDPRVGDWRNLFNHVRT
jgi:hypothetical protein